VKQKVLSIIILASIVIGCPFLSQDLKNKTNPDTTTTTTTITTTTTTTIPLPALPFLSRWDTTKPSSANNQISLPLISGGTYDFLVDWGDGKTDHINKYDDPAVTHKYAVSGEYTVTISGTLIGFAFIGVGDCKKLMEIKRWGILNLGNSTYGGYFDQCSNLQITATDIPDLTATFIMVNAFKGCRSIRSIPSIEKWNMTNVTDMSFMFYDTPYFDQDIGNWNVSGVTNMHGMFMMDTSFNRDLSAWNIVKVTDMSFMFSGASLSTANYDSILIGWSGRQVTNGVYFDAGSAKYTAGGSAANARNKLTTVYGWYISDSGTAP
jgi:surface protein